MGTEENDCAPIPGQGERELFLSGMVPPSTELFFCCVKLSTAILTVGKPNKAKVRKNLDLQKRPSPEPPCFSLPVPCPHYTPKETTTCH